MPIQFPPPFKAPPPKKNKTKKTLPTHTIQRHLCFLQPMVFLHSCRLKFTLPCYISKNYVSTFPDWPDFFSFPHVSDFNFKFGTRFYFSYFNIRLSYLHCFCQKDVMFLLYKYGTH